MRTEKGQPGYVKAKKTEISSGSGRRICNCDRNLCNRIYSDRIQTESAYRCSGSRMPSGSKDVGGIYHNGTI